MGSFVEEVTPELGFEGEVGFDRDGGRGSPGRERGMRKPREEERGRVRRAGEWTVGRRVCGCPGCPERDTWKALLGPG